MERAVTVLDESNGTVRQLELLPEDRVITASEVDAVRVRLSAMKLERPRQWGACWLADTLWRQLHLDGFFADRLWAHPRRHRLGKSAAHPRTI